MAKQKSALDLSDTITQSNAFLLKNRRTVLVILIAIVVVVGGVLGFKYLYLDPTEEEAQAALGLGDTYFFMGDFETCLHGDGYTFPGYLAVADGYTFTKAKNVAKLYAGLCYAQMGDSLVNEAIAYLEDFTPGDDISISPAAVATLANCYVKAGDTEQAIKAFKKAAKLADNEASSPYFLLEAGKLYEHQGQKAEALKVYEGIKKDYPASHLVSPFQQANGVTVAVTPEIDKYIARVK